MTITKKLLLCALALVLALGCLPALAAAADYPDMPTGWSADAVRTAVEAGLLEGDEAGLLRPAAALTRAELATMLVRVFGGGEPGDVSGYSDLRPGQWHYEAFRRCVGMGLLDGYPDGTMRPERTVTRAELFTVMARALGLPDGDRAALGGFPDADKVPDWAVGATAALARAGYIEGTESGLNVASPVTREQFCQIVCNVFDEILTEPGVYTGLSGRVLVCADGAELRDSKLDALCVADRVEEPVRLVNCECGSWLSASAAALSAAVSSEPALPPEDPELVLAEAYARFREAIEGGYRVTLDRTENGTRVASEYALADGVAHAVIRREDSSAEYIALVDGSSYDELLIRAAGVWRAATQPETIYSGFKVPTWPESLEYSHYNSLGGGLFEAQAAYRDEEGAKVLGRLYTNSSVTALRLQVVDGQLYSVFISTRTEYAIGPYIEENQYVFSDLGQVELSYPDEIFTRFNAEGIYDVYSAYARGEMEAEDFVGVAAVLSGVVCATLDDCVLVRDHSGCLLPVYFSDDVTERPQLWDEITAVGVTEIGRFKTTTSVLVGDPERLEIFEGEPETRARCSDLMNADVAPFDAVDFLRLQVPAIPEEDELAANDYLIDVEDENGNPLCFLLEDASLSEPGTEGSAARFRSALREFVREQLEATGAETCSIDFCSILLDGVLLMPARETSFAKAAPPTIVFSPAERTILAGTSLEQALCGVRLLPEEIPDSKGAAMLELDYASDYDPDVPGDYVVEAEYRGATRSFTLHVEAQEGAFFEEAADLESLGDLDSYRFPRASLPSTGDVNILVIPIRFTDSPDYDVDLDKAFNSTDGSTGWYSLREYYETTSYGALRLTATILEPYETGLSIEDVPTDEDACNKQPIILSALAAYDDVIDFTEYNNNGDEYIDCVYFIYDAPSASGTVWWAINSWYWDDEAVFDGLQFSQYLWMSAEWFGCDLRSNEPADPSDGTVVNCRTLIHETGHALALDDYYSFNHNAVGDTAMMCGDKGDHDPLSKLILDWIDPAFDYAEPRTVTLRAFPETGDTLVVSAGGEKTAFSEYYTVTLYTPTGANAAFKDDGEGLFSVPGVAIYYVNAELKTISFYPIDYFKNATVTSAYEDVPLRLVQNNGRETLRSCYGFNETTGAYGFSVATDEDLFQQGDIYLFTWRDETLPCVGFSVDEIGQDAGGWYAVVTVG